MHCCGSKGRSTALRSRGPRRAAVLWCQCPRSPRPTALLHCDPCFLISQMQSSVTQIVYLACLPQPGGGKERAVGGGGLTSQNLCTK